MKISKLWTDTEVRPFRLITIIVAILVAMLFTQKSDGQTTVSTSSPLNWTTSFDEAIKQAEAQNAPIMLYFNGSDWCPWSQKLTQEVFETDAFAAWADAKLIPVYVDFPKKSALPEPLAQQNNTLLSRYRPHLSGFPTALFVKPDGTVVGKLGYVAGGARVWTHKAQSVVARLDKVAMRFNTRIN